MERRSTVLLGEAQEHFVVDVVARLEMMCRGLPTEPLPQDQIDKFTKAMEERETRRVERIKEREREKDWNAQEQAHQFLMDQFPLGFNPHQPPPMLHPTHFQHQYIQRVSPMYQGPCWPQCGPREHRAQVHQGFRMPSPGSYHAEFPPLSGQELQYQTSQNQRLPYRVPHYTELPRASDDRQQILAQEVPQHPQAAQGSSSRLTPQQEDYYVELNKSFLRAWARIENLCLREYGFFEEELFLKLAEWATPAPPGMMWTSWGLIHVDD